MTRWSVVVILAVGVAGCRELGDDLRGTSDEARVARNALDAMAAGNVDGILSLWDPTRADSQITSALGQLALSYPHEPPKYVQPIGAARSRWTGGGYTPAQTCAITFQSEYAHATVRSEIVLRIDGSEPQLIGFHANPVVRIAEKGISFEQIPFVVPFILFMLGAAGITVGAVVAWVRGRKRLRHPILWLVAIVLGLGRVDLMMGVARFGFRPLYVQLLSVGFWRSGGPSGWWTLSFSLPLGAMVFLYKVLRRDIPPPTVPAPPDAEPTLTSPGDPAPPSRN